VAEMATIGGLMPATPIGPLARGTASAPMSCRTSAGNPPTTTRRSVLATLFAASLGGSRLTCASPPPASTRYDFREARDQALAAIAAGKATGLAVAAVHRDQVVWAEGFGWANREAQLKATAHTPFSLASISKPFTTAALATLAAEGKLSLDDSANSYLGEIPLRGIENGAVTIRQLGAHAAGLPSLFEMYPSAGSAVPPSVEQLLRSYGRLAFPPGNLYEYSNIGYAVLGEIASRLTRQPIGEVITQRILIPLGLRDSFFDTDRSRLVRAAARYDELDRPIPYYSTATPASGEVYASAHDLARFASFNLKNQPSSGAPVLAERWIDEMHAPVLRGPGAGATTFGWFLGRSQLGHLVLFKDGGQPGVSTILYLVPSENLACVVLANRTDNGDLTQSLVDRILATVLPGWATPDTKVNLPSSSFRAEPTYVGHWLGRMSGDGVDMRIEFEVSARAGATLAIAGQSAQRITDLQLRGPALVGEMIGSIAAGDAERNHTRKLSVELLPYKGLLVGRILASTASPGSLATIPFTIKLDRLA
jgi:CubicO group peptidase (beta-lactamase class C family)